MKHIKLLVLFLLILSIQCNTNDGKVASIVDDLEKEFDANFKKEFKSASEKTVLDTYFSYFLYRHSEFLTKYPDIDKFFQSLNLKDDPSQSYVLLLLYHRKLNDKKINLNELIENANKNDTGARSCGRLKNINAVLNYNQLNIGDKARLLFSVRIHSNIKSTIYYMCPTLEWTFDDSKDLAINGEIINKYIKDETKEFYIELKIENMNREDVLYFFKRIQRNDTVEINLNSYGMRIME